MMANQKLLTGHKVVFMDQEFVEKWEQNEGGYHNGFVRIMPHGHLYPGLAPSCLHKIYNFKFRPDDVLLITYPKSGTVWTLEILWTMVHNPDLNHPDAHVSVFQRAPHLETDISLDSKLLVEEDKAAYYEQFNNLCPHRNMEDGLISQIVEHLPGRRVIGTHFPLELLPSDLLDKCKVVYVARNPLDAVVSLYHFMKVVTYFNNKKSLDDFMDDFISNNLLFGSYWHHVQQSWEKRNHPNLEFVFFEDMKADIMGVLKRLDKFMCTNLTQKQLENVKEHTSFTVMKARGEPIPIPTAFDEELQKTRGGFYRRGKSGGWKNELTPHQVEKIENWVKKNIGKLGPDFKFTWDVSEAVSQ